MLGHQRKCQKLSQHLTANGDDDGVGGDDDGPPHYAEVEQIKKNIGVKQNFLVNAK